LLEQDLQPELTVSSAALRARETTKLALSQFPGARIEIRDSLYHAGLATLVNTIREQDNTLERLMLVGHNPGMDQLLVYLCKEEISLTSSGKLMTTAALARIVCRCPWAEIAPEFCNLESLLRPSDFQR
jgi:phosphohistidine phosphatase